MNELKSIMLNAKKIWFEKGFSYDGFVIVGTISGSKEMHDNYGDTKMAFSQIIKLVKENKTEEEIIEHLSRLAKILK